MSQEIIGEKQKPALERNEGRSILYKDYIKNKSFNALEDWLELSREVQEDFRQRGITKEAIEDAIAWARKRKGRR
ncbi:hypothetical protein H8E77_41735 [bacterium]|nr:hypothetical protein [bacterium]